MASWHYFCTWLAALSIIVTSDKQSRSNDKEELVFLQTVWRHGLMTPEYDFVHPELNGLRAPLPEGLVKMFQFGQLMRQRYIEDLGFLNPKNAYSEVYTRSIDFNRSIEGASAKLAGMLPVKEPQLEKLKGWPSNWMPMPIHMVPLDEDAELNMNVICPRYEFFEKNRMNTIPAYNKTLEENQDLFDYLSKKLNMTVTRDLIGLVWAAVQPGLVPKSDIPRWVNDSLRDRMLRIAKLEEHYKLIQPEMILIRGGPLATAIYNRMVAKWEQLQNGTKVTDTDRVSTELHLLKYFGYSCRGMPIMWQLATVGNHEFTSDEIPAYTSSLIYELWNRNKKPYISVSYYNGNTGKVSPVQVKECPKIPDKCPLEDFGKTIKPYLVDPVKWWYEDCGKPQPVAALPLVAESGHNYRSLAIIFAIIIIVLTLLIIIQICILMRPKRRPGYDSLTERTLLVSSDIK